MWLFVVQTTKQTDEWTDTHGFLQRCAFAAKKGRADGRTNRQIDGLAKTPSDVWIVLLKLKREDPTGGWADGQSNGRTVKWTDKH